MMVVAVECSTSTEVADGANVLLMQADSAEVQSLQRARGKSASC